VRVGLDATDPKWYPMYTMSSCERWEESISALADGEEPDLAPALVQSHVADCPDCRRFADRLGYNPADTADPSFTAAVVRRNVELDRAEGTRLLRALIALCAVAIAAVALQPLVSGQLDGITSHDARHVGAFGIAFAAALGVVVWRPARARSIVPVTVVLAAAVILTAALDIALGAATVVGELIHLPELLSVLLVWLLATPAGRRPWPGRR
jgi:predicted anti-sigma-YlaC factor YlaD